MKACGSIERLSGLVVLHGKPSVKLIRCLLNIYEECMHSSFLLPPAAQPTHDLQLLDATTGCFLRRVTAEFRVPQTVVNG